MPAQALDGFGGVDEGDLVEVEVIPAEFLEGEFLMDGERRDEFVVEELGGAEEEGQELVVIETPDAVGAGWFEVVGQLHCAHYDEIA